MMSGSHLFSALMFTLRGLRLVRPKFAPSSPQVRKGDGAELVLIIYCSVFVVAGEQ